MQGKCIQAPEIIVEDTTAIVADTEDACIKKYLARVIKPPSRFYRIGEEYVITEPSENGYYSVFLKSRPDYAPVGAYLTDCFEIIEPYVPVKVEVMSQPIAEVVPVLIELPPEQWQQMDIFNL